LVIVKDAMVNKASLARERPARTPILDPQPLYQSTPWKKSFAILWGISAWRWRLSPKNMTEYDENRERA
jgi:hypothetical protein